MTSLSLILLGAGLFAMSGVLGLLSARSSRWGELVAVSMTTLAAAVGLAGVLLPGTSNGESLDLSWGLPWGRFAVGLDPLSRAFLLPVFLVPALGMIYGLGYWRQAEHPDNGRKLRLFYGLLAAAMVVVVSATNGVLFLLAWEVMAISAFFLITTEDDEAASRNAGWVYFVATHVGTLALLAMFALMRSATGSFSFGSLAVAPPAASISTAIFVLAAIGFGIKGGLMPLHVWLPGAHANAPSHVSAVLSGVMLKMGVYGLVRMTSLLAAPPAWWGGALLAIGAITAVLALLYALAQHDLKRLLAYSSIENIGIITIGIGLALVGRSTEQPAMAALGLGGALLHVWNHSLFKPLLFLGAGSVLHGAGTRRIDHLGGLAKRMPCTAGLFLVGCVAICALPPLNGFVSELLIYLGLLRTLGAGGGDPWPAAVIPALALAGGLAAVAFTKLFGAVFLGEPRTDAARRAHESPLTMLAPMLVLALGCFVVGIFPAAAAPLLDATVATWWSGVGSEAPSVTTLVPLGSLTIISLSLLGFSVTGFAAIRYAMMRGASAQPGTWDCGYAAPGSRMQYTGSSYSQFAASLFSWALLPRIRQRRIRGLFPAPGRYQSQTPDAVLERVALPAIRGTAHFLRWARHLQQGHIQIYVLYVLLIVLALFISMIVG